MVCYIGVGANVGDRLKYIKKALMFLRSISGIEVRKVSSVFETEPVGGPLGQKKYFNLVVEIKTKLLPKELFVFLKEIERKAGRKMRKAAWAKREIDLDILSYGRRVVKEPGLAIPHLRMHERIFVLKPFLELAPKWRHPVLKKSVEVLLKGLKDNAKARRIKVNV